MREETYSVDWAGTLHLRWTRTPSTGICVDIYSLGGNQDPGWVRRLFSWVGLECVSVHPETSARGQREEIRPGSLGHQGQIHINWLQVVRTTSYRCRKAKKRRWKIFPELRPHARPPRGMLRTHGSLESWQQAAEGQHCHPYSVRQETCSGKLSALPKSSKLQTQSGRGGIRTRYFWFENSSLS